MLEGTVERNDPDHPALALLDALQRDFPLVERPFEAVGRRFGLGEQEVLTRLSRCRELGWLARLGPVFAPHAAGASTLAALAVPRARLEEVAAQVSAHAGVNHNYERSHPEWNLWFVATAPDRAALGVLLDEVRRETGLEVLELPLVREFRIDLAFPLLGPRPTPPRPLPSRSVPPVPRTLVAALQDGLELVERPFDALAARAGLGTGTLLAEIGRHLESAAIRRFGAVVNHRALGWTQNAMCVWVVPDADLPSAGERLAELPFVTLCYQRRPVPAVWPFNLYCMVHGKDRAEVERQVAEATEAAGLGRLPRRLLFGVRAFAQRGGRYAPPPRPTTPKVELEAQDRALLAILQEGLEIVDHPFAAAAAASGLSEAGVVERVRRLREQGALSRFGPLFDVERFGGHFTLAALAVPEERFEEVAGLVNAYPEVAHNYEREHVFNMWFVLATETPRRAQEVLREIAQRTGLEPLDLPRTTRFRLSFRVEV